MDRGLQMSWLVVALVTTVGVIVAASIRRERPERLPIEHIVAATITAVFAWDLGVSMWSSLGEVGLGSTENSVWILGHAAVAVAGLVALVLVLRRHPLGVPLAIGVCVLRLATAGTAVASILGSTMLESNPDGIGLIVYTAAMALPALFAIVLFVTTAVDGRRAGRRSTAGLDEPIDAVAEGRP